MLIILEWEPGSPKRKSPHPRPGRYMDTETDTDRPAGRQTFGEVWKNRHDWEKSQKNHKRVKNLPQM